MASNTTLAEGSQTLLEAISSLRDRARDSDFSIECGEKTWPVHKLIVRAHSKVLAKNFDKAWEENPIPLRDDKPCVVQAMIDYMYTADYSDALGAEESVGPTQFNVLVYTLADKFDIQPLARLASSKFKTQATFSWSKDDFAYAIEELYDNAPDKDQGMRDTVVGVATMHAKDLLKEPYGVEFRRVISDVTVFGAAFSLSVNASKGGIPPGSNTYFCIQVRKLFYIVGDPFYTHMRCPCCGKFFSDDAAHPRVLGTG